MDKDASYEEALAAARYVWPEAEVEMPPKLSVAVSRDVKVST